MAERGRWEALFADLDAEAAGVDAVRFDAEVRERTRREWARVPLANRLAASVGRPVAVTTNGAGVVRGLLTDAAPAWLLVDETVIPAHAVTSIAGLADEAREPSAVTARLDLGYVLRALARRRVGVVVTFVDGTEATGTIDRVGTDFADLAEHPRGEPRRSGVPTRVVPFGAIAAVRPG